MPKELIPDVKKYQMNLSLMQKILNEPVPNGNKLPNEHVPNGTKLPNEHVPNGTKS